MDLEYYEYLKSAKWAVIRDRILKRDGYKCTRCDNKAFLQVHHLTYDNIFEEKDEDLITLCKKCHRKEHHKPSKPAKKKKKKGKKVKITREGQKCRHCGTPVVKKIPQRKQIGKNQKYFYQWYLYCPKCYAMYMVEKAKVIIKR